MVNREPLLPSKAHVLDRCVSDLDDELSSFRKCLPWLCIDQSSTLKSLLSWSLHLLLSMAVPLVSHFVLSYSEHRRTFESVVQASLSAASSLSFLCVSGFFGRYRLRRFLFLDKLSGESRRVRVGYVEEIDRSFRMTVSIMLPCLAAECGYKAWWYYAGARKIPFLGNPIASDIAACTLELASWTYRRSIFLLTCVLFRLACNLQILRLQDFAMLCQEESDVVTILKEHSKIRRDLKVISHRFSKFIVAATVLVTGSQFAALFLTMRPHAEVSLFNTGELALCSIGLVTGLLICLRSAAKITHKAQSITSHAAKWHVCATIDSFDTDCTENRCEISFPSNCVVPIITDEEEESDEHEATHEDEVEGIEILQAHANTVSFQKRQALVTYLENNGAGITVLGFMFDRRCLHMVFMIVNSLFLWVLGKTIGFS